MKTFKLLGALVVLVVATALLSAQDIKRASGAGTPGGLTTQVQYNNSGVFAGDSAFTWDNANKRITLVGTLSTGSDGNSIIGEVASGMVAFYNPGNGRTNIGKTNGDVAFGAVTGGNSHALLNNNMFSIRSGSPIGWSSSSGDPVTTGANDTALSRNAAGVVEVNNGTAGTWRDLKVRTLRVGNAAAAPTCSASCGTSPSVVGSDSAMTVTMGATGTPASPFTVTFNTTWAAAPTCTVASALASMVIGKLAVAAPTTTTTVAITTNGTAPANSDKYFIQCIGVQ